MGDYPKSLSELKSRFGTEEACRDYLFHLRWPEGFFCPRCHLGKAWPTGKTLYECAACHFQVSVTSGTIFHRTRTPLSKWFWAIWWMVTQKNGASALGLKRVLGLGSYETAWSWLHKIRRAMVRPGRDRLMGCVEVDETYLGGLEKGVKGRETFKKALVVVAAQENGTAIGRIRMRRVPDASTESLHPFILDSIEPGSTIHTDAWKGYEGLKSKGYVHRITNIKRSKSSASELLPRVHLVISLLKRWVLGTHQGAVSQAHLDYYLDELLFDSTGEPHGAGGSCSTDCSNRL